MTKIEAQEMIKKAAAENKKIHEFNEFMNEGGEGYEVSFNYTAYEAVEAAGFGIYEDVVYSREDFETLRKKWNDACIALKGQKVNIGMIAKNPVWKL